jgi:dihydrolipoamide dehydrogenase
MSDIIKVLVPDIGDFDNIEVIEILVSAGDSVQAEQTLITLESDKASMDIPAPHPGRIESVLVTLGDRVSEGAHIADLFSQAAAADTQDTAPPLAKSTGAPTPGANDDADGKDNNEDFLDIGGSATNTDAQSCDSPLQAAVGEHTEVHCQLLVLGAGPGGYTAAFRAADLGLDTILVERYNSLGGVCLNVGCIPSKALLHTAQVIDEARSMAPHGVSFGEPDIDLAKLVGWKNSVVGQLTKGLSGLARQRKVKVLHGTGSFDSPNTLRIERGHSDSGGTTMVHFEKAIIAAGSQAVQIGAFPNSDPRLMDSTDALLLEEIPNRMLVIGGGIIGLEMAGVYQALGTHITVVELLDGLIPGADRDLVRPLQKHIEKRYENIFLSTRVTGIEPTDAGLKVSFEGDKAPQSDVFDKVLVAVGRAPNGGKIGADRAGVHVDERGFINVDRQQRTNVEHIFAIGDIVGQPMLAHKATHEAKVAAEVAAGEQASFDALSIPSVAYTDPELAWCGLTETEAKAQGIDYRKGVFPWAASGRALGNARSEGMTKVLFDKQSGRVLGAGIVGTHAGDLISEAVLALEMGADADDLSLTIHPHPTLSETINFAAEVAQGTITDLYIPKKRS